MSDVGPDSYRDSISDLAAQSAHLKFAHLHIRYRSIKLRDIIPYKREDYVIYLLTIHIC